MEATDEDYWKNQYCDVGDDVDASRWDHHNIQRNTLPRDSRIPYLLPRCAPEYIHEHKGGIENKISPYQGMDNVVNGLSVTFDEDMLQLEED